MSLVYILGFKIKRKFNNENVCVNYTAKRLSQNFFTTHSRSSDIQVSKLYDLVLDKCPIPLAVKVFNE